MFSVKGALKCAYCGKYIIEKVYANKTCCRDCSVKYYRHKYYIEKLKGKRKENAKEKEN